ncbi:serine carboxypeptidase-like 18 isoform X4 [Nicotiana tomentosiformis]|uniref:serine carboxypeptidase-like 18 isoform X4 n=1 Tax=Nicotiana tomentosiformis TaxID=4098 RepID=UPI00388C5E59
MQYCLTSLLKLYQASMENFLSNSKLGNYVGVGEEEKVQLYYYFVESERDPENDPLMLWLTGGPGCSGLSSFVYEIGPLTFDYANSIGDFPKLELKSNSWTKVANIIFIDQPAGSGYSYAKTSEAYNFNDTLAVALTYEFLRKGYIQGNALTDHYIDFNGRVIYAHRMGLISDKIYQSTKANCNGNYAEVDPNNVSCLNDLQRVDRCLKNIRRAHILEPWCDLPFLMSILKETPANARSLFPIEGPWCREKNYIYSYVWANDKAVKKALNVREGTTLEWVRCNDSMHYRGKERTESYVYDVKSVIDDHRHLISKSCRALIYSGDHDMVVPHSSTEEWIDSLKLPITDDWEPWFVDGQVAGYKVKYSQNDYEMTYATVKGGGHTAPEYKPEQCLAMVDRWFSGYPL